MSAEPTNTADLPGSLVLDPARAARAEKAGLALAHLGHLLSRSLDPAEVARTVLDTVGDVFAATAAALYQIDDDTGDLVPLACSRVPGMRLGAGVGCAGLAAERRRPVQSDDILDDPRITLSPELRARLMAMPYRAVLAVPLIARDRVIGALAVGRGALGAFEPDQVRLMELFAEQAALVLDNAALFERAWERTRKLTALTALTQRFTSAADSDAVFQAVGEAAVRLLGARAALVWVDDPARRVLRLNAVAGEHPNLAEIFQPLAELPYTDLSGIAFTSGAPVFALDVQSDSRWRRSDIARDAGLHACAAFPMLTGDGALGSVTIGFGRRRHFTAEENELMQLLTDHAAIAIERRRNVERIEAARAAAETAVRAKGEFLAVMSHEIRTPLNAVIGASSLLLDTPLNAEQAEYVETVRRSSEALLTLINDILDFSKIEAGRLELEQIDFDLAAMVNETLELLAERAHAKGLELGARIDPGLPGVVCGDPGRLRQVILNLAGNALKFTPAGSVCVRVKHGAIDDRVGCLWLRFEIADTGIGIVPDTVKRLFRPFSQADTSTTRRYGGTGLGLAICKRLTDAMGGEIGVESEMGRGSTFWFTAPLTVATTAAPAAVPGTAPGLPSDGAAPPAGARATTRVPSRPRRLRVLVAEDNSVNQTIIARMLERAGHDTSVAGNGREAMTALAAGDYDVVLMDCQMPEMDGFEATRAIRAAEAGTGRHLPIVALTANAMQGDRERCLDAGMDDYLAKPITRKMLSDALDRWSGEA